jgi:PAS domain S-box-containing protein
MQPKSSDFYSYLYQSSSEGLIVISRESGEFIEVNSKAAEIFGHTAEELLGANLSQYPYLSPALEREGFHEDISISLPDSQKRYINLHVKHFQWKEQPFVQISCRDNTEKRFLERELITKHAALKKAYLDLEQKSQELEAMQKQLIQAGKMSALGRLATGVAHELNQPLTSVRGFAQEMLSQSKNQEFKAYLDEIIKGSDRMKKIIEQLRSFAVKESGELEEASLDQIIENVIGLLGVQLKAHRIRVETKLEDGGPSLLTDPFQLEQVLINLVSNARDALVEESKASRSQRRKDKGGHIRIQTSFDAQKDQWRISVEDNGPGIAPENMDKIFDPFFTTKEVGKGMGLGLSMCFGMIEKLGGYLMASGSEEEGAVFTIFLPRDASIKKAEKKTKNNDVSFQRKAS